MAVSCCPLAEAEAGAFPLLSRRCLATLPLSVRRHLAAFLPLAPEQPALAD